MITLHYPLNGVYPLCTCYGCSRLIRYKRLNGDIEFHCTEIKDSNRLPENYKKGLPEIPDWCPINKSK